MGEKFRSFMQGRYGVDALTRMLFGAAVVCMILSFFPFGRLFYLLAIAAMVYGYYRTFSRNYEKRYRENQTYIRLKNRAAAKFRKQKDRMMQRKHYHIYTCAQCRQKIRIPRGHGKIMVTCPKCKYEFQKRS